MAFLWAALALPLHAAQADREQPLNVEADNGRYDDLKQVGLFVGNVVVTKGTMVLRAARVELQRSPEGYQLGVATGAPGQLVGFRQERDGNNEYVEGQAERIEYDGKAGSVRLVDRAVIRRYRGGELADETAGSVITYDNTASIFTVSGSASGASSSKSAGRVRATLGARGAASAAAPARPVKAPHPSEAVRPPSREGKR